MALLFLGAARVPAAVFIIADGDVAGLKSAMVTAASNNEADTIFLATNGTYILTTVDNTTHGPSGLPVIGYDNDHAFVIAGNGSTIRRDPGAPDFRIFTIYNDLGNLVFEVSMDGLTISNGKGAANGGIEAFGGGIYNTGTTLLLNNCTISGNFAGTGGGIINEDGTVSLTNCTLAGNSAGEGGGIWNESPFASSRGGVVHLRNCTFSGNTTSSAAGSAIGNDNSFNDFADARYDLTGCTLDCTGNSTGTYGIYDQANHGHTQVGLADCILNNCPMRHDNPSGGTGGIFSSGYNLSNDNGSGVLTQTGDQINTDPGLDPLGLQNNGGPTQTIALTFGSLAIDKGKSFGSATDQRGVSRPYDNSSIPNASGGDGSDIGAYEAPQDPVQGGSNYVVTNYNDHDDGVCSGADCTLREAINRANAVSGINTIVFTHAGGTVTLTQGELAVTDSVAINGFGNVTVSGNGASRIFDFTGGSSSLSNLTIRDGFNQINTVIGGNAGGGVFNSATLQVNGCLFANNHVLGGAGFGGAPGNSGQGGAIYNSGTLFVNGSAFTQTNQATGGQGGNSFGRGGSGRGGAGQGGALFNDSSGSLTVTNCTFSQNVAMGGNGGSGGTNGGDGGNGNGGAIFNLGTMTVMSTTIDGNSGSSGTPGTGGANGVLGVGSGGVAVAGGTAAMTNNIVAGNVGFNGGGNDVDGTFASNGFNLIGTGNHSTGFNGTADQVGTDLNPIDPRLFALQNNVMLLRRDSPALDRGNSAGLTTDQRGGPRPVDTVFGNVAGGDGADIGAVEMNLLGGSDSDHDGMSDDFEILYGFNPNDPTDANGDLDNDGLTNLQEFQAGTNPRDPTSTFQITNVSKNGSNFVVTFATALPSKSYRLERKDNLSDPLLSWGSITGVSDFSPVSVGSGQITDPGGASVTKRFYHVRITP